MKQPCHFYLLILKKLQLSSDITIKEFFNKELHELDFRHAYPWRHRFAEQDLTEHLRKHNSLVVDHNDRVESPAQQMEHQLSPKTPGSQHALAVNVGSGVESCESELAALQKEEYMVRSTSSRLMTRKGLERRESGGGLAEFRGVSQRKEVWELRNLVRVEK
nr:hypothetical protein Iba_chr14aCG21440 [Ipomoea batatas]